MAIQFNAFKDFLSFDKKENNTTKQETNVSKSMLYESDIYGDSSFSSMLQPDSNVKKEAMDKNYSEQLAVPNTEDNAEYDGNKWLSPAHWVKIGASLSQDIAEVAYKTTMETLSYNPLDIPKNIMKISEEEKLTPLETLSGITMLVLSGGTVPDYGNRLASRRTMNALQREASKLKLLEAASDIQNKRLVNAALAQSTIQNSALLESTVRLSELAVDEKQVEIELEKAKLEALRMGNEEELLRIERLKQLYKSTNPEDIAAMKNYAAKGAFAQAWQATANAQEVALREAALEEQQRQFDIGLLNMSNQSILNLSASLSKDYGINTADWIKVVDKTTKTMIDFFRGNTTKEEFDKAISERSAVTQNIMESTRSIIAQNENSETSRKLTSDVFSHLNSLTQEDIISTFISEAVYARTKTTLAGGQFPDVRRVTVYPYDRKWWGGKEKLPALKLYVDQAYINSIKDKDERERLQKEFNEAEGTSKLIAKVGTSVASKNEPDEYVIKAPGTTFEINVNNQGIPIITPRH